MNWTNLWLNLFGTTELFGLNMGFWVSMAVVTVVVILMNVVFWCMKPKTSKVGEHHERTDESSL